MIRKKKRFKIILAVIAIIGIIVAAGLYSLISMAKEGQQILEATTFKDIDISEIEDGTYTGAFEAGLVYAKAEVTIEDKKISKINLLEHRNGKGKPAEKLVDQMVAEQTTNVDVISGATYSSKVIRKAVENTLVGE